MDTPDSTPYDLAAHIRIYASLKSLIKSLEDEAKAVAGPLMAAIFASGATDASVPDLVKVNIENKTTKTITKSTVATITAKRTRARLSKVTVSFDPAGPAKVRKVTA